MRAVLTKVKHASVTIDGELKGKIGRGFLILLGVAPDDTEEKCRKMADKLCSLRIFDDENDKINLSLDDVGGDFLSSRSSRSTALPQGPPSRIFKRRAA